MNLAQLLQAGYNDIGAEIQEGGSGNCYEWIQELETLIATAEEVVKLNCDWTDGSAYVQKKWATKNKEAINKARTAIAKAKGESA